MSRQMPMRYMLSIVILVLLVTGCKNYGQDTGYIQAQRVMIKYTVCHSLLSDKDVWMDAARTLLRNKEKFEALMAADCPDVQRFVATYTEAHRQKRSLQCTVQ